MSPNIWLFVRAVEIYCQDAERRKAARLDEPAARSTTSDIGEVSAANEVSSLMP
jgi:hypothetical protein